MRCEGQPLVPPLDSVSAPFRPDPGHFHEPYERVVREVVDRDPWGWNLEADGCRLSTRYE